MCERLWHGSRDHTGRLHGCSGCTALVAVGVVAALRLPPHSPGAEPTEPATHLQCILFVARPLTRTWNRPVMCALWPLTGWSW